MANYNKSFNFRNGVQVDEDDLIVRSSLVGIGTTIPTAELDVRGTLKSTGIITANNLYVVGVATFATVQIGTGITIDGNAGVITAKFSGDGAGLFNIPTSQWVDVDPAIFPGVGLGYSSIYSGGTVGVGTTIPRAFLQIGGDPDLSQGGVGISSIGNIKASGIVTAGSFVGSGAGITAINASNITSGTLDTARLSSNISVSGLITATTFSGQVNAGTGTVTTLSGTTATYTTGNFTTGNITTGVVTTLSGTTATYTTGNFTTGNITTGVVTSLSGTTATYTTGNFTTGNITTGVVTTLTSTDATLTNISSSGISTLGTTSATNLTAQQLNVSGVSTFAGITTVTGQTLFAKQLNVSGIATAGTLRAGNVQLGVGAVNQIDTTSGNLVLDSAGGQLTVNDNIDVSGTSVLQGEVTANTGIVADTSTGAYLGQSGKEFSELWVDDIKIGVGVGNSNKIETTNQDLVLDAGTNQTLIDSNLRVAGVATVAGNLTLGSGIEPSTDNTVTLGTASKRFSSSQIAAIRIGVGATNKIDTVSGTSLTLDSSDGTTTVDDKLVVTGIGTFNSEVQFDIGVKPDTSKGAYIGTTGTPFSQAFINEIQIGVAQTNKIDTREGSLRLDGANNVVAVDNNLTVGGTSTLTGNLTVGGATDFVVNTSTSRVGVGTNILSRKFQVKDSVNLIAEFRTDTTDVTIGLGRSAVGAGQSVGKLFYSTRTLSLDNEDVGGLEFVTNSGNIGLNTGSFRWRWGQNNAIPLLDLTYDGKLGLGITNPTQTLHVVGTSTVTDLAFFNKASFVGVATFGGIVNFNSTVNINSAINLPQIISTNISTSTGFSTFFNVGITSSLLINPLGTGTSLSVGIGTTIPRFGIDAENTFAVLRGIGIGISNPVGILTTDYGITLGGISDFGYGKLITLEGSRVGIGTSLCDETCHVTVYGSVKVSPSTTDGIQSEVNYVNIRRTQVSIDDLSTFIVGPYPEGYGATILGRPRAVIDFGSAGSGTPPVGSALTSHRYLLPPIITTAQRSAIGVGTVAGAIIFNSDTNRHQGFDGTTWNDLY